MGPPESLPQGPSVATLAENIPIVANPHRSPPPSGLIGEGTPFNSPTKPRRPRPSPQDSSPQASNSSPKKKKPFSPKRPNTDSAIEERIANLPADWQTWPEFTVFVDQLPQGVTTTLLWNWFSSEGAIAYMDINDSRNAPNAMYAQIRFEPPPKRAFWMHGRVHVKHPDTARFPGGLTLIVTPARTPPQCWVKSRVSPDKAFPMRMELRPKALRFGSLVGPTTMKYIKTLDAVVGQSNPLRMEINLRHKRLSVFFPYTIRLGQQLQPTEYKFVIDFSRMKEAHRVTNGETDTLVIPLRLPPSYYWKRHDVTRSFSDATRNWSVMEAWNRATDIVTDYTAPLKHPVAVHTDFDDPDHIDIARWTTFALDLSAESDEEKQLNQQFTGALEDYNINVFQCDDFSLEKGDDASLWRHLDRPAATDETNALSLLTMSDTPIVHLDFEVRYQLEVCITRGILNEHNITPEFLEQLAALKPMQAKLRLEYITDQDALIQDPKLVFQDPDAPNYHPPSRIPHYCALVRKAVITPTSVRFNTPAVETSNRVMRRYNQLQDRFLRVQFVDEHEQGRITVNKDQNDDVWKRVLRTMFKGIRIGDRTYEFLAFGSSQLRQCGAYFFCPTDHVSCDDIRKWMGQFNHIKIVAKYAARLGQCFSTTREIRGISVPTIRPIEDIDHNGYCFTDGVGKMSPFVAKMVIEEMALDVYDHPSAFQFRMGGCKGVLAVWPDAKGTEVHIRESQEKFKADFNGLEIIRCARFATATLNRQTITILESLKVPISAFENLLDQQLKAYELAMEDNDTAIELLTKHVDENQTTLMIADMLRAGFKGEIRQEPFVLNVLNLWRSWSLKLLKEKARIQVEKSAFVLGCVDETGTLRGHSVETEGSTEKDVQKLPQIFLQITDSEKYRKTTIIKGVCLVGRNPSLHPGDIRVVQAVDCPQLRHLKDVVVFPSKGDRPVPNMLSGGDLDGDDFFVIWDPTLIPKIWNYRPMDYTGSKPLQLDRDVNVDDLRNFFVMYMKNDKLPLIATSHLAFADDFGPMTRKCLELAELHSKAVDYPKTGDPATLRRDQQPRRWPHFMQKRITYHSRKALGIIYDKVVKRAVDFNPIWDSPFDSRITRRFQLSTEELKAARQIKSQYDTSVRRLLSQHDLKTEFELWSAFAMTRPAVGSDYKRQEDLGREYDALKHRFRDLCYEAAGGKGHDQVDRFVAAMYTVSQDEVKIALHEHRRGPMNFGDHVQQPRKLEARSMPLISFPWIFHWVMVRIALGGQSDAQRPVLDPVREGTIETTTADNSQQGLAVTARREDRESRAMPKIFGVEDDAHTHLPDGTVIHRGQPLVLFHPEEEGDEGKQDMSDGHDALEASERDERPSKTLSSHADEGKSFQSKPSDDSRDNVGEEVGNRGDSLSDVSTDESDSEGETLEGPDVHETAGDRLERLMGGYEDDE